MDRDYMQQIERRLVDQHEEQIQQRIKQRQVRQKNNQFLSMQIYIALTCSSGAGCWYLVKHEVTWNGVETTFINEIYLFFSTEKDKYKTFFFWKLVFSIF